MGRAGSQNRCLPLVHLLGLQMALSLTASYRVLLLGLQPNWYVCSCLLLSPGQIHFGFSLVPARAACRIRQRQNVIL